MSEVKEQQAFEDMFAAFNHEQSMSILTRAMAALSATQQRAMRAEKRVAELEAALRPFAEMADDECRHLYMQEIARARHLLGMDK